MVDKLTIEELLAFSVGPKEKPSRPVIIGYKPRFSYIENSSFVNLDQASLDVAKVTHLYGLTKYPVGPLEGLYFLHRHAQIDKCDWTLGCMVWTSRRVHDWPIVDWFKKIWTDEKEMELKW